jgi:hypothetical protein
MRTWNFLESWSRKLSSPQHLSTITSLVNLVAYLMTAVLMTELEIEGIAGIDQVILTAIYPSLHLTA